MQKQNIVIYHRIQGNVDLTSNYKNVFGCLFYMVTLKLIVVKFNLNDVKYLDLFGLTSNMIMV